MYRDELAKLSKEELIALGLAQAVQIEELTRRVAELEAKLGGPPKTPDNSSVPPSQGRKPNRAERRAAKKRKDRPGVFRALAANPDRIIHSVAERCPHCEHALTTADQSGFHAYDHIELPPWLQRTRARGDGIGLALWPGFDRTDPAPARHPGDRVRTAGAASRRSVRGSHQRRRDRQHAGPSRKTADGCRRDHRRGGPQQQGGGLGRDLGPGRGKKLVAMGAALFHRSPPSDH